MVPTITSVCAAIDKRQTSFFVPKRRVQKAACQWQNQAKLFFVQAWRWWKYRLNQPTRHLGFAARRPGATLIRTVIPAIRTVKSPIHPFIRLKYKKVGRLGPTFFLLTPNLTPQSQETKDKNASAVGMGMLDVRPYLKPPSLYGAPTHPPPQRAMPFCCNFVICWNLVYLTK